MRSSVGRRRVHAPGEGLGGDGGLLGRWGGRGREREGGRLRRASRNLRILDIAMSHDLFWDRVGRFKVMPYIDVVRTTIRPLPVEQLDGVT